MSITLGILRCIYGLFSPQDLLNYQQLAMDLSSKCEQQTGELEPLRRELLQAQAKKLEVKSQVWIQGEFVGLIAQIPLLACWYQLTD